tara:strand:- start:1128 stop:1385 length:258 start_codon:yes stop_codon:yes gene_type:complete
MRIKDNVHHPDHYTVKRPGDSECIDCIRSSMSDAAFAGYLKGSVIKYLYRYEDKGGVESLQKAHVFLKWLIECEGQQQEDKHAVS